MKYYFNALRNIASQSLQILYVIVLLRAEVVTIFEPKIQLCKKFRNFASVYFLHFTASRHQICGNFTMLILNVVTDLFL